MNPQLEKNLDALSEAARKMRAASPRGRMNDKAMLHLKAVVEAAGAVAGAWDAVKENQKHGN